MAPQQPQASIPEGVFQAASEVISCARHLGGAKSCTASILIRKGEAKSDLGPKRPHTGQVRALLVPLIANTGSS